MQSIKKVAEITGLDFDINPDIVRAILEGDGGAFCDRGFPS